MSCWHCVVFEPWVETGRRKRTTNASVAGTKTFELREILWHPTKNKIEDWLESKILAFMEEESVGSQLSTENWVDEYIYSDIHEIFFAEFPIMLHEWLSILARRHTNLQRRETLERNDQLVCEVTSVSNTISGFFDFWVDSILQGYIIEFAVGAITSYSEFERKNFEGPRRRYWLSISTWIKMVIYEKGNL